MTDERNAIHVPRGGGDRITLGALPFEFIAQQQWVDGAYTIARQPIAPRLLVAPHRHRNEDQVAIVLSGVVGFRVGDEEFTVETGGTAFRRRGVLHSLWNPSDEPAEFLEITSPGHFEEYFRRFGALSAAGEADADAVQALGAEYGMSYDDKWVPELSERYGVSLSGGFWEP